MGSVSINLNIKNDKNLTNDLLKHLLPDLRSYLESAFDKIRSQLSILVVEAIKNSPEYDSLVNGQLKAEFGLPDSETRVSAIIDALEKTYFEFSNITVSGNKLKGKFSLNMIESDYNNLLSLPEATLKTEKGTDLHWLEWLLLLADQTIIKEYEVVLGPNPRSRTGLAVMKKTIQGKWSVPSEFSGSINNNWITRAIDSINNDIENLIDSSL